MLNTLLSYAVSETVKRSSIWQCIIKASRPRIALPSSLPGLGIECDHVFRFKWLVDELFKLGFSITYSEVNRFKKLAQLPFSCSKSTIETLGKGAKYLQS